MNAPKPSEHRRVWSFMIIIGVDLLGGCNFREGFCIAYDPLPSYPPPPPDRQTNSLVTSSFRCFIISVSVKSASMLEVSVA